MMLGLAPSVRHYVEGAVTAGIFYEFEILHRRRRSPPSPTMGENMNRTAILALILAATPAAAQSYLDLDRENVERAFAEPKPAAPEPARPDPTMTPGAVDPHVTLADICTGTTRSRRHVSPATRAKVMRDYNMPAVTTEDIELDHLVPLAIGGSNAAANLWPQPGPDYGLKDRLEVEMQRRVCVAYRTLAPAEAEAVLRQEQAEIAADWVAAAARYLPGAPPP